MWFVSELSLSLFLVHFVSILEKLTTAANQVQNYSDHLHNANNSSTVSISRTQQALSIIDRLLQNYDFRLRPHVETGQPENVTVQMIIQSISSVSEANMDFTVNMQFRQTWIDPRLAYGKFLNMEKENGEGDGNNMEPVESVLVSPDSKHRLWEPDTYFKNERTSFIHNGLKTPNENWVIYPDGTILKSTRLTLTSTCPMNFAFFPMDHQICSIQISSYHFQAKELVYAFVQDPLLENEVETLPYFKILGQRLTATTIKHAMKNPNDESRYCSLLTKEIMFSRSLSYYLIQVYSPINMITLISFFPLWLDPVRSIAERIAIGVTLILTLTTLISAASQNFPTVSYTKSIDVFTGACLTFGFLVLLENMFVIWVTKRRQKESQSKPESKAFLSQNKRANDEDSPIFSTVSKSMDEIPSYLNKEGDPGETGKNLGMTPEEVDRKARIILPSLIWVFYISYFAYYWTVSRVDTSEFTQ